MTDTTRAHHYVTPRILQTPKKYPQTTQKVQANSETIRHVNPKRFFVDFVRAKKKATANLLIGAQGCTKDDKARDAYESTRSAFCARIDLRYTKLAEAFFFFVLLVCGKF